MEVEILVKTNINIEPSCVVVCQGREENVRALEAELDSKEFIFLAGVWDKPVEGYINLVGTTWGEGRNYLLSLAHAKYSTLDWLWIDDDTRFEMGGISEFVSVAKSKSRTKNAVCVPQTEKVRNWGLLGNLNGGWSRTVFFDEQVMYYPASSWRVKIIKHDTCLEDISWFTVAEINENLILTSGVNVIQLNEFSVSNLTHADQSDAISLYQRANYRDIHYSLNGYFRGKPLHWSRFNFRFKNYVMSRFVFKVILLVHSFGACLK